MIKTESELVKTKTELILNHLMSHEKGISSLEAFELFKATRLSAIIFSLRKKGYNIVTVKEDYVSQKGMTRPFARYILIKEETNE